MWRWVLFISVIISGLSLFVCKLPAPPPGPESATVDLGFELPSGEQVKKNVFEDTIGNQVKICMFLNLTQYFDSVVVKITMGTDYVKKYSFNTYAEETTVATYPIIFSAAGEYNVILTAYIDGELKTASATIIIRNNQQVTPNNKPVLTVPQSEKIGVGQELTFSVTATDPDNGQQVTIIPSKKPESATFSNGLFKWTPGSADTGLTTVTFVASDNGDPVKSDTESVVISVSSNQVNRSPRWISNTIKETLKPGVLFSYDLSGKFYDPDNDSIKVTLLSELPPKDTIIGSVYTFTPASSDTGKFTVHITARDPAGLEDTLKMELTVSSNPVIEKVTITFDKNGADIDAVPATKTITSGATIDALPTPPSRAGYTFAGWNTSSNGTGIAFTAATAVTISDTVYAQWTAGAFTITYNLNGGTNNSSNPVSYTVTMPAIALANPTKAGFIFAGWFDNTNLTGTEVNSIPAGSTGDKTFWAKWTTDGYTITYNLNGGTNNAGNPASYDVTSTTITLASPSKAGYAFGGWFDNAGLTGTAVTSISTGSTGNKSFWAKWTADTYTITYNLNGGTNSTSNPASYNITSSTITLANPSKNGFTFGGWYDNSGFSGTAVTTIPSGSTGEKVLWAKWSTEGYTITYNLNGGTNNANNPSSYNVSSETITLAAPNRNGYTFGGWYDNSGMSGTAVTTIPSGSTGNKAFFAKWTIINYSITYTLNGGTNGANPTSYTVTSAAITLVNATRNGYGFGGWYDNSGLSGAAITSIPAGSTGDKAFYAKWTVVNYSITYNLNGGTNNGNNPTSYNISSATITLGNPNKSCNNFGGWFDNSGLSGTAITSIVSGSIGDKSLYAKWSPVVYIATNPSNTSICAATGSASMTVNAPGATSYQWYDGNGVLSGSKYWSGQNSATLSFVYYPIDWNGTSYYCIASNGGCSAKSNPATLTVTPSPQFNDIVNSSWVDNQGVGRNPNNNFWVEVDVTPGTTFIIQVTNSAEPQFAGRHTYTGTTWPEICSASFGMTMSAGTVTIEYWIVDNTTGCESSHGNWPNPAWIP